MTINEKQGHEFGRGVCVCVDVSGFAEKKGRWKWHNYINHKILKKQQSLKILEYRISGKFHLC